MRSGCKWQRCRPHGATAPQARAAFACGSGCLATYGGTGWASARASSGRLRERPVIPLVVLPILARPQRAPPILVVDVPTHCAFQPFRKSDLRFPTELGDTSDVDRVSIRAERVRAAGHEQWQAEARGIGACNVLATCFARRVRAARLEGILFARPPVEHLPIYLVGAD